MNQVQTAPQAEHTRGYQDGYHDRLNNKGWNPAGYMAKSINYGIGYKEGFDQAGRAKRGR